MCSKIKSQFLRRLCCSASFLQPPTSREVHAWCLFPDDIPQMNLLCSYESILPCEERNTVYQAKNKNVQKEYLLTRVLARTLIARYTRGLVDPNALRFERGNHGKSRIVWPRQSIIGELWNPPRIAFNISHTRSLIVCAVTGASQVGIDVEEKYRVTQTDLIKFARRRFSEMEVAQLEQLNDLEARKQHFLELWTLKESYGKAIGNGIAGTTLRDAAFAFDDFSSTLKLKNYLTGVAAHEQVFTINANILNDAKLWQFILLQLTNSHNVSICVQQVLSDPEPFHLDIMKTIPLVKDEPFFEAVALGLSI
ncbi:hypothetical protein L7F22_008359 [Adiantum nelumboides]|nr:hypothetical protein [Adiantum nelumboides]